MIIASIYHCPYDTQLAHDMSAAILTENNVYAYEEEKLTGTKNEASVKFPERSLMMGCKELNIVPSDINYWVFPTASKKIKLEQLRKQTV